MSKKKTVKFVRIDHTAEDAHTKNTKALAKAAPVDTRKAKAETEKKKADPVKVVNQTDDIKAWKENVMTAVEAVLDAAIKEMANA